MAVLEPTLVGLGVTFGAPDLTTPPTAGTATTLTLPVAPDAAGLLPSALMIGTRWDRLDAGVAPKPASPPRAPATGGTATATVGGDDPGTTAPSDPTIDLVVPEQAGEVVAPVSAKRLPSGGISVTVTVPASPGLYRLVATVHRPDGVAYDASTQALVPALVVRVTGPLTATYGAPATAAAAGGAPLTLKVRVGNLGRSAWGHAAEVHAVGAAELEPAQRASLVARWVDLGGAASGPTGPASPVATAILPAGLAPGASVDVDFLLTAPAAAGEYLLVLDVVDPTTGSLAAAGVPPGIVRVTVTR